jgi:hypothetical protein
MDDDFWGDIVDGRLSRIIKVLYECEGDIVVKQLPFACEEDKNYFIPMLLLTRKPNNDTLRKMESVDGGYKIRCYVGWNDDYDCLMVIEILKFFYKIHNPFFEEKSFIGVYDRDDFVEPIIIIPFNMYVNDVGEKGQSLESAEYYARGIVDWLNKS